MSFLGELFKTISYYDDTENPLHDTEFVMDGWDELSEEQQKNYLKSLLAGVGIAITLGGGYFFVDKLAGERLEIISDKLVNFINKNEKKLQNKTYEEVYDSLLPPTLETYDDVEIRFKDEMKKGIVQIYQEDDQNLFKHAGGFFIPRKNIHNDNLEFIHFRKPNPFKNVNPFTPPKNVDNLAALKNFVSELDDPKIYINTPGMSEKYGE